MTTSEDKPCPATKSLVSFVLPVCNEADSLRQLYEEATRVLADQPCDYELLFVDDGSTDGSFEVLQDLHGRDPKVKALRFRRNFGKAAAYSAGFREAKGDIVITMDTDLQDDPEDIPLFLGKMAEGCDMVVGWKHEGKGPAGKSIPSSVFNKVVSLVTGLPLHDFNCPFKAYRREVLEEIDVHGELHRYIPVLASAKGFTIDEIKIRNRPRRSGASKYGLERYPRGMLDLFTVTFITRFAKRPLHLLGLAGLLALTFGGTVLGGLIAAHFFYVLGWLTDPSWNIHDRPALGLGILLIGVGVQLLSIGLVGELVVTTSAAAREDGGYSIKQTLGD